jgi:hypothetical protein
MRGAIVGVVLALAVLVVLYSYGSPEYRRLKKDCVETGMDHSDARASGGLAPVRDYSPPFRTFARSAAQQLQPA